MSFVPPQKSPGKPRVLVAPLDWGLGHATRCIPVIYELISQGAEPWLAGDGALVILLKKEFPDLPILPLRGYAVRYRKSGLGLAGSIMLQIPSILRTISYENEWLKKNVAEYHIDAVISDNRYGLYHETIPTVFITHQLRIMSPFGKWMTNQLQKINYSYINRFGECWIPDQPTENNFAGALSHPGKLPSVPSKYTGILSRFNLQKQEEKKEHVFISISGPEPHRTLFENKILEELNSFKGTVVIVRGLPEETSQPNSSGNIRIYNHLPTEEYAREISKAEWVIARSGYSTVMDLMKLQKKSVLVPTPGQTEQEYLGAWLEKNHLAASLSQKTFSLQTALEKAMAFKYSTLNVSGNLSEVVSDFLNRLKKRLS